MYSQLYKGYSIIFSAIIILLANYLLPAQDLVFEDTTFSTNGTYTGNSITAGPGVIIESAGDVIFHSNTLAIKPEFSIVSGGRLQILTGSVPVGISEKDILIPENYNMSQNYPNPFNPVTTIKYRLPEVSNVELSIFNALGQKLATLVSTLQEPGEYNLLWDASGFSSGIYYYRINVTAINGDHLRFSETRKLVLLK